MNYRRYQILEKITINIGRCFSSPALFILLTGLYIRLARQAITTILGLNPKCIKFSNKEGFTEFNFSLPLSSEKEGVSAILRVKNEEQKIIYCLKSIINVFDEIIFVDNGSEDLTLDLVKQFKQQYDEGDKIKIYHYPWKISRCGAEHFATPENSVHSLAYYYNWTLSHCTFKYACKWDADMVLRKEYRKEFKDFLKNKVLNNTWKCWILVGQTVYRSLDNNYFLSQRIAGERRLFPYSYLNRFFKEEDWEVLRCFPPLPIDQFPEVVFYELKFTNENELSNWSPKTLSSSNSTIDMTPSTNSLQEEIDRFQRIKQGQYQDNQFTPLSKEFLDYQISDIHSLT